MGLSALFVTPYLFRMLGTSGFGTWVVMFTLVAVFVMLEEGFSAGITKFVAAQRAEGRRDEVEATLGAAVILMAGLGALGFAVCSLIGLLLTGLAAGGEQDAFRLGMIILGGALLLRVPLAAYGAVLAGYQRYDLYYLAQVVTILTTAIASIAAVAAGAGVLALAVVYSVALVIGGTTFFVLLRRLDPSLRTRPHRSDRAARRLVFGFSSFTTLADSMRLVGNRLDSVVIAAIKSASAAAPFAAASTFQTGIQTLTLPATKLIMPMTSELEARKMRETVIRRLVLAIRVSLQVTMPVAIAAALFSTDIIDLWLGADAPAVTAHILTVMSLSTLTLCCVPATEVLVGVGQARTVAAIATAQGLSNLAISIVLVTAYGAIGAAIGTLATAYLIGPVVLPLVCRATGIPLPNLLRDGPGRAIAASLPSMATMLTIWLLLTPGTVRLVLGLTAGIGLAVLVAVLEVGPGRVITELKAGLGTRPDPEQPAPSMTLEGPI